MMFIENELLHLSCLLDKVCVIESLDFTEKHLFATAFIVKVLHLQLIVFRRGTKVKKKNSQSGLNQSTKPTQKDELTVLMEIPPSEEILIKAEFDKISPKEINKKYWVFFKVPFFFPLLAAENYISGNDSTKRRFEPRRGPNI